MFIFKMIPYFVMITRFQIFFVFNNKRIIFRQKVPHSFGLL